MRTALTIAGSDSIAGAGIQADLKTFAALGVYGVSALTAVTAQDTQGVADIFALPPEMVRAQIDQVAHDVEITAVKTGMLVTGDIVRAVSETVGRFRHPNLVVDPVMAASGPGARTLLAPEAVSILKTRLLPVATVVTPNVAEAETLSGIHVDSWRTRGKRRSGLPERARLRSSSRAGTSAAPRRSTCFFMRERSSSLWGRGSSSVLYTARDARLRRQLPPGSRLETMCRLPSSARSATFRARSSIRSRSAVARGSSITSGTSLRLVENGAATAWQASLRLVENRAATACRPAFASPLIIVGLGFSRAQARHNVRRCG